MKTKLVLFVVVFLFSSLLTVAKAQVNVGDSLALVDLYNSTGGPGWTRHKNWLQGPVAEWVGITVENSRVVKIELPYNNMTGSLPSSIGNLSGLHDIDLSVNNLTGIIPSSIGNLASVLSIDFFSNQLSGSLPPSLTALTHLQYLDMSYNQLSGGMPTSTGDLTHLQLLNLGENKLSGSIPASIGNLIRLQSLHLDYNKLTGSIPASIGKLANVVELYLDDNQLTGDIPYSIGNLKQMQYLFLHNNQLTGNIPASIINLANLYSLWLSYNQLSQDYNIQFTNTSRYEDYVAIDNNRFNFNGLESLTRSLYDNQYSPQASIPIHQTGTTLSVSAGGTLGNNTYQWFRAGEAGSTMLVGDSIYHPMKSGRYYATITNAVATQLTLITDTVSYTAPLTKSDEMTVLSIFPNPSKGMIGIYGLDDKSNAKITVADMSGYVWVTAMSNKKPEIKMDVSRLKAGNYLVSVNEGREVKTVEFVKE